MNRSSIARKMMIFVSITLCLMIASTAILYTVTFRMVKDEVTKLSDTAFAQIYGQVDTWLAEAENSIKLFSYNTLVGTYLGSNDMNTRYEQMRELNTLYLTVKAVQTSLKDLLVMDTKGHIISLDGKVYNNKLLFESINGQNSLNLSGIKDISSSYSTKVVDKGNLIVSCPVFYRESGYDREMVGYMGFLLDVEPLVTLMDTMKITRSAKLLLFDKDWNYVTGTTGDSIWQEEIKTNRESKGETRTISGEKYLYFHDGLGKSEFNLVCLVPRDEIYSYGSLMKTYGALIIIIQMAIILLMSFYINKSIAEPIKKLLSTIVKVQEGNINERVHLDDKSEIGNLANNFDEMMDRVKVLTKTIFANQSRMYELELKRNEMEIIALQNQINPHFLYNTLACIRSIAICNKQKEISAISKALAQIYNYILKSPDIVSVSDELAIVKSFIDIYQVRIGARLKVEIDILPELMEQQIMKLILQPLVENAVEHGILEKIDGGTVHISGYVADEYMEFNIADDGEGMSEDELERIMKIVKMQQDEDTDDHRSHLGLYNIITRLKLMYQQNFAFEVSSKLGEGTVIKLRIPFARGILPMGRGDSGD